MFAPSSHVPVVAGFHPDPTAVQVDGKYYLAHSSFEFFPGVPIWESTDLKNWEQIGNVLTRPSQFPPGERSTSDGVYAPTLRYNEGKFYLITTDVRGQGHFFVTAEDPRGPWSDPVLVDAGIGIDPDLAWDGDDCYLTWTASTHGNYNVKQVRIDDQTGELLEEPYRIWSGTGLQWPEAPHLYHVGDWWYLLLAEGGTERGHVISVARAKSPSGPFEGHPNNPIFTHRSTDHPVFSVGHGDLIETGEGNWAIVYLGTRPAGDMPGYHVNGRETFLAGIEWRDGWPVIIEDAYQIDIKDHSFEDDFSDETHEGGLHPRWTSPGVAFETFVTPTDRGIELDQQIAPSGATSGLSFRVTDKRWECEADTTAKGSLALRLRQDDTHWYQVGIKNGVCKAVLNVGPLNNTAEKRVLGEAVTLWICTVDSKTGGPDDVILGFEDDAGTHELVRADGRYLSTEVAGGFIGRVALLHSQDGPSPLYEVRYRTRLATNG